MKFIYPFILILFFSCDMNNKIDRNIKVYRFEKDLFNSNQKSIDENKKKWEIELGQFANAYYAFLTNIDPYNDSLINNQLLSFIDNNDMREVFDTINKKFEIFSHYEDQLNNSFYNFSSLFPEYSSPKIVTMLSGFNYGVIVQDSLIVIGLDFYLGENSVFYQRLGDPEYLRFQKQTRFMISNIMEAWYDSFFSYTNNRSNFLSELIYKGKIMFLLSETLPKIKLEDKLRYSREELNWCLENESLMWSFLIENDLLFSSREKEYRSYLYHSPFSKGMTNDSPSRIAYFIGYQIVKKYMKINNDISIQDLMLEEDYMLILNKSKYKP